MMNNQSLLSCELDQQEQDIAIVKKRDFSLVTSYTDEETSKKRAKTKKSPKQHESETLDVWISAILLENENPDTAVFYIYYGPKDSRNCFRKTLLLKGQDHIDVLLMGVVYVLKKHESDSNSLAIHVGSGDLYKDLNQCESLKEIKELVNKRKNVTFINYATSKQLKSNWAYKSAIRQARQVALKGLVEEDESTVGSLDVAMIETETNTKETITENETGMAAKEITIVNDIAASKVKGEEKKEEKEKLEKEEETIDNLVIEQEDNIVESTTEDDDDVTMKNIPKESLLHDSQPISSSWAFNFSLRNVVDILKAPFGRK
ncbi:hypothetical protein G6F37_004496 [Rhizopus arrhizus]|nr:hypothetical protein G6F38_005894 [Rhizopus arrhizus]KAG1159880.1 hypothetical protein G6F37_004496 [Rhizopus arrhizus]